MFKKALLAATLVATPVLASAATVSAINDYTLALAEVDQNQSLALPGVWTAAPRTVNPDASISGAFRSPFQTDGENSAGYYTVGGGSQYVGTSNPAELALNSLSKSISLLWGSPDRYNTLELFNGINLVATILGSQFNVIALEASFVTISADSASEYFDTVRFTSQNGSGNAVNAFEFANVTVAPVPVPAGLPLILTALGGIAYLSRRKQQKNNA
ncbi:hypothetical protein ROLI_017730 [Roseobacter fucihabitans]|uniref:Uncharacterized protein n=1 Tax=Roseobacter fucihabitans TaxID=1537242 RepID=A0ABZ2BRW5_9RHOB|nr:VPLPA-CTERM sorting domain-containing protein [Roseobacter litoralis]MBC6964352.1 hypothetical protein [Roseobacter litoralis]